MAGWGDEERLRQVFTNLLGNALRHTPPGGMVRVDIRRTAEGTQVSIDQDVTADFEESMTATWTKALELLKQLCEEDAGA